MGVGRLRLCYGGGWATDEHNGTPHGGPALTEFVASYPRLVLWEFPFVEWG